jgi:hypothetical protein
MSLTTKANFVNCLNAGYFQIPVDTVPYWQCGHNYEGSHQDLDGQRFG